MKQTPSVFGISVIFGGIAGMMTAPLAGFDAGAGFVIGFAVLFGCLSVGRSLWFQGRLTNLETLRASLELLRSENRSLQEKVSRLESIREALEHGGKVRRT
jgi:hypothetical protein